MFQRPLPLPAETPAHRFTATQKFALAEVVIE
jgi:hypothetical protein